MKIFEYLLDFIYPKKCIFCGEAVPFGYNGTCVCNSCRKNIPYIKENTCRKCGIENKTRPGFDYCERCLNTIFSFRRAYAVFNYKDTEKAIKKFKYDKVKYLGLGFALLMKDYIDNVNSEVIDNIDLIVPVPISEAKKAERGFNHMDIIAHELSVLVNIPCDDENVIRIKDTVPQSSLKFSERADNVKNAFRVVNKPALKGKRILLVDDVLTSGSTLNECAKEMIKSGAKEVTVFTVSIAGRHS